MPCFRQELCVPRVDLGSRRAAQYFTTTLPSKTDHLQATPAQVTSQSDLCTWEQIIGDVGIVPSAALTVLTFHQDTQA